MYTETEMLVTNCPNGNCRNEVVIERTWWPGGDNDYGSFEVRCKECGTEFDVYVGRDLDLSSIYSGADLLKKNYKL